MIKTWYEEYEKIKDKAIVVFGYEWESMADEQKEKILAEKTVIMSGDSGYACKRYQIIGNANNLSDHECAIIADGGNLCFGYRMEGAGNCCIHRLKEDNMEARELANKLYGRAYGDSFDDVLEEAKQSGLVIVTGASDDLMEFNGAICDEGGCFDGGRVYFDKDGVDQEGEERANWIDARWCDGMNRDGLPATWTYETEIPCERFDIWEDGEVYCVGLVFSIEDLK